MEKNFIKAVNMEPIKAHQTLDKAVDLCYRPQSFPNETKRIEFLLELYDKYTAGKKVKRQTAPAPTTDNYTRFT